MITRKELEDNVKTIIRDNLSNAIKKIIIEDMLLSLNASKDNSGIKIRCDYLDVYDIDDMVDELERYVEETISDFISDKYEIVSDKEMEL